MQPTAAAETAYVLNKLAPGLDAVREKEELFAMAVVVGMSAVLMENKRSYVYQLMPNKEGLGETFLPFLVDSDFNKLVDAAFLKEKQLTRYLCNKCEKYYLFIGECGNMNHGNFKSKCPLCENEIGAAGYGKALGLKRCDPNPIQSVNRDKLYVCLPGYQEVRPGDNEQVRNIGGLPLR